MKRLISGFLQDGFKEEREQPFRASAGGNKAGTRGQGVRGSLFRVLESVLDFLDSKNLASGAPIRIMFKKYSGRSLVTRVIRLAPHKHAS